MGVRLRSVDFVLGMWGDETIQPRVHISLYYLFFGCWGIRGFRQGFAPISTQLSGKYILPVFTLVVVTMCLKTYPCLLHLPTSVQVNALRQKNWHTYCFQLSGQFASLDSGG